MCYSQGISNNGWKTIRRRISSHHASLPFWIISGGISANTYMLVHHVRAFYVYKSCTVLQHWFFFPTILLFSFCLIQRVEGPGSGKNVLTLTRVEQTENYTCIAVSKLGNIEATTTVEVRGQFFSRLIVVRKHGSLLWTLGCYCCCNVKSLLSEC